MSRCPLSEQDFSQQIPLMIRAFNKNKSESTKILFLWSDKFCNEFQWCYPNLWGKLFVETRLSESLMIYGFWLKINSYDAYFRDRGSESNLFFLYLIVRYSVTIMIKTFEFIDIPSKLSSCKTTSLTFKISKSLMYTC